MGPTGAFPTICEPLIWSIQSKPFKSLFGAKKSWGRYSLRGEVFKGLEGSVRWRDCVERLGVEVEAKQWAGMVVLAV